MRKLVFLVLAAVTAFAADEPWTKVRELKSGTELRVYKKGSTQPMLAKFDEATDDNLLVVVKNEQVAIARDLIDRLDYRPVRQGGRIAPESKTTTTEPDTTPGPPGHGSQVPGSSTSTGYNIQSKPEFEEIYRRPRPKPKTAPANPKQ